MQYLNYITALFIADLMYGNAAGAAIEAEQIVMSASAAPIDTGNAVIAVFAACAVGAAIYIYRHRRQG